MQYSEEFHNLIQFTVTRGARLLSPVAQSDNRHYGLVRVTCIANPSLWLHTPFFWSVRLRQGVRPLPSRQAVSAVQ